MPETVQKSGGSSRQSRNYSLDLLRIISMFMIVCLHSNSHGGLMEIPETGFDAYRIFSWCIQAMSVVSVDVFVLISGYFLCQQSFRLSRVFRLMLQTWFYSWIICLIFIVLKRLPAVSSTTISSVFAISFRWYWFISAYIGMSLLSPILNHVLDTCSRVQHLIAAVVMVLLFSTWCDVIPQADPFAVSSGSSLTWFITLYVVAAYIRRYVDLGKVKHTFKVFLGLSALLVAIMLVFYFLSRKISLFASYAMHNYYFRFNSGIVLASAIALFLTFLKHQLYSGILVRLVKFASPLTLGVYLIHDNPLMRDVIWKQLFPLNSMARDMLWIPKTVGSVVTVFVACIMIDFIRAKLFSLIESTSFYKKGMNAIDRIVPRMCDIIEKYGTNAERND